MADLDGGEFLADMIQKDVRGGMLFQKIITGLNRTARAVGVAPVGEVAPPSSPDSISVAQGGEMLHVSINHNAQINRGVNYFTEIATDPAFSNIVATHYHGPSRTSPPFNLPTKDNNGDTYAYHARSYAQYPGGKPSAPVVHGGAGSPTPITMGGSTQFSLLPSTGSGTSPANGQSAGQGFGKQFTRPATGPKRSV